MFVVNRTLLQIITTTDMLICNASMNNLIETDGVTILPLKTALIRLRFLINLLPEAFVQL